MRAKGHRRLPKLNKQVRDELLDAFEQLCKKFGVKSMGFDYNAITATKQWALSYTEGLGWMIVCGLGGCGCALSRWNGYIGDGHLALQGGH